MVYLAGYWPSYNVPFYEEVYNRSGYPGVVKEHGTDFSYQLAPRAKIFRRDQAKVVNMADMKAIMRYNGAISATNMSTTSGMSGWSLKQSYLCCAFIQQVELPTH